MSTLVELQCFNKLLLQKMQRMQKKIEKLEKKNLRLNKVEIIYDSLFDVANTDYLYPCEFCELWKNEDDVRWIELEDGSNPICINCYEEKNYYCCSNCGEHYCEDEMKKIKDANDDELCKNCYKGYLCLDIMEGNGYIGNITHVGVVRDVDALADRVHDVINIMVYEKDILMEELLKKVKTN